MALTGAGVGNEQAQAHGAFVVAGIGLVADVLLAEIEVTSILKGGFDTGALQAHSILVVAAVFVEQRSGPGLAHHGGHTRIGNDGRLQAVAKQQVFIDVVSHGHAAVLLGAVERIGLTGQHPARGREHSEQQAAAVAGRVGGRYLTPEKAVGVQVDGHLLHCAGSQCRVVNGRRLAQAHDGVALVEGQLLALGLALALGKELAQLGRVGTGRFHPGGVGALNVA